MLRRLSETDLDQVFDIMRSSFPTDEYRTYDAQRALFQKPSFRLLALGDPIQAFAAVYQFDGFLFIEHLAVRPELRNKGLGAKILKELRSEGKTIILEVELPTTDLTRRRIGFYQRNGFFLNDQSYVMPSLGPGKPPIDMKIMTTKRPLTDPEFERARDLIYRDVYDVI